MITRRTSLIYVATALTWPITSTSNAKTIKQGEREGNMSEAHVSTGRKILIGSINPGANVWTKGMIGESTILKKQTSGGSLKVGMWRTSASGVRCQADGSCLAAGNAPVHDAVLVIEGSGTISIASTGTNVAIEPGLIVSHPQGIDTRWDIAGPYMKKLFVEWDRTDGAKTVGEIHVGHVSDDPETWRPCKWEEAGQGIQEFGEAYIIRRDPGPDFALVGIWRGGAGVGRTADGVTYSGTMGETTLLVLEGRAKIHNHETGEDHEIKSGDVVALAEGQRIAWTNDTPFVKAFFVVTKHVV